MTSSQSPLVDHAAETLDGVRTLDDVAGQLRAWRTAAGSPSFTQIARRVAEERRQRGVHPRDVTPGRMTVYDAFADGRKRLDVQLVVDIAAALGVSGPLLELWHSRCVLAQGHRALTQSVSAHRGLPRRPEVFIGRRPEQQACLAATTPVVIEGMAGTGKTELAFEVATAELARQRALDVVVVALGDTRSPDDLATGRGICEAILRTLGAPVPAGTTLTELADTVATTLEHRRVALVLDDVTVADQVVEIIGSAPSTPVIITSRARLPVGGITRVPVSTWATEDSLALLRAVAGGAVLDAEPAAARTIAELVDGLPLAAALTAARVRRLHGWSLADQATALRGRLESHQLDEPVSATIALSYSMLSEEARRCLRLLAAQPCRSVSRSAFDALVGDDARSELLLDELESAHLVLQVHQDRVSLHSLVRTYAVARSWHEDPPSARSSSLARMAGALLARAWGCSERLYPGSLRRFEREREIELPDTPEEAAAWLEDELEALVEIAAAAVVEAPQITLEIAQALSRNFDNRGRLHLSLALHRAAVEAARGAADAAGEAYAELGIGTTSVRLGLPEAALHLERARQLGQRCGARRAAYSATNALAILSAQAGDAPAALRQFQECLEMAREDQDETSEYLLIDNIAIILRRLGDLDGALKHHREALERARAHDSRESMATALGNISEVYLLLGRVEEAVEAAERSREVAHSIGSSMTYAHASAALGLALDARGESMRAVEVTEEALRLSRDGGLRALEVTCLNNLGHLLVEGDLEAAEERLREADQLAAQWGIADERPRTLHGLGRIDIARGHAESARDHLEEALDLLGSDTAPTAQQIRGLLEDLPIREGQP